MIAHRDVGSLLRRHSYTELRKIGEGSFGKAILVQTDEGSKLVCKMVDVSQASSKETQDAIKEGRLLAAFKHPYIVRYRESFIDNGWLCILMDYCEGGDLSRQIEQAKKRHQPFVEEQVLRWMTQALLALKYIHDKHILHRDLKSSNFFLSKSNNLKMGDFGIAKVLSCTAACARTQIGTPYYLSPEVCQEKPYTWPSDIWAMGCILFELCALKVPFDAANISGLVQKICRGPTPIIQASYTDFVKNLCTEMLSRNPNGRPSAESVLQRPRIQGIVKQMLDEAQQAQEASATGASADAKASSDPVPTPLSLPPVGGPYSEFAGKYQKNTLVEYHSHTHKDWLPATVVNIDAEGRIVINLKPNTWIAVETQAQDVRPRRSSPYHHGVGPPAAVGVATPLRQRSPSIGAQVGSARGSTPGRGRDMSPSPVPFAGVPARAMTPSRLRENSPSYRYAGGGNGSRAPSPGRPLWREPSQDRLARVGPGGGGGSRAGSRASTPTPVRVASPRQNGVPFGQRRSEPVDQVRPPGMPGLPRVPGSPNQRFRMSPAAAAGMAIAGV
jgi:NIMA (never in mitosis gene a)-related kinase